ncbi:MAG: peptidoglycan editing factor PgeF [Thiotrichales bacterium]|nr:peptidoglycan editing factor PgeF [Thiotrichales bacterium]
MPEGVRWIPANWPAPEWLHAGTSLRSGGHSSGAYRSLNLAMHVHDRQAAIVRNRQRLIRHLSLPAMPVWLNQVHDNHIIDLDNNAATGPADGALTSRNDVVCAVLTADCVPVMLANIQRRSVAAVHAGWRGISRQIITRAVRALGEDTSTIMAWIGPNICARHYEIDTPVREACLQADTQLEACFYPTRPGHWQADLGQMVEILLKNHGINKIHHSRKCTFENDAEFFSHRRQRPCGRMASMIWMSEQS